MRHSTSPHGIVCPPLQSRPCTSRHDGLNLRLSHAQLVAVIGTHCRAASGEPGAHTDLRVVLVAVRVGILLHRGFDSAHTGKASVEDALSVPSTTFASAACVSPANMKVS